MASDLHLEMNEYLPLRDVVFNTLRQAILRGELKPGERLMEIALSQRLGVSRTPVREAIRMLEQEGLVIMIPRKGAQVAEISEKDLKDVIACQRITEEELEELEQAVKEFEEAMKEDNLGVLAAADVKVHEVIYGSTHNKRLVQIISNIREQMYRYRVEYLKDVESRKTLVEEHYAVYRALKARNQQQAVKDICIHIVNQQNAILRSLEQMNKEEQEK